MRILDRERNALGVPQQGFAGTIVRIGEDKKGAVLFIAGVGRASDRQGCVRPAMVKRQVYRPRAVGE